MTSYSPAKMSSKENLAEVTPDAVILHQFPRNLFGPSLSPYALKLETYLRAAKVTYANDFNKPQGPKGKCPWITYKNQDVSDSSMCVEFLKTNKLGLELNPDLSAADKAISRAFQKLIEEELCWVLMLWRWCFDKGETTTKAFLQGSKLKSFFVATYLRREVKKQAHGHGIGRHSPAEVMQIGENDIRAVGEFLGDKKYMMGETVSDVDCTVFGCLAQLLYCSQTCPLTAFVRENCPNVVAYCDRMKAEFWPDWEEICLAVAKPAEKEKKSLKSTASTDSNGTAPNGTAPNGTTTEGQTIIVVKEPEVFTPTAHGDILVQEIESTKTVTVADEPGAPKENGVNGHATNGFSHHEETNGFHHHEETTTTTTVVTKHNDEILSAV